MSPTWFHALSELRAIPAQKWTSFFAAWIGYLLDGFDFVLITLVLTEIGDDFGLSPVEAASLVSGAFITRWLGGALLGALGDRFGRKAAMVTSIVLYSAGTFACGFSWNYLSLFGARLLIGMGMAGEYSASATYVLESWPARLRNRASGFLISGFSLGGVLAAEVYARVVPEHGWRWLFWIGRLPVTVALWVRRALPEADEWEERVAGAARRPDPFRPLFADLRRTALNGALVVVATGALFAVFTPLGRGAVPVLSVAAAVCLLALAVQLGGRRGWLLYVALIVTVFAAFLYSWPVQALLPTYLKTELGYRPSQVADALYWAGFGTAFGCVVAGFLGDRFGTRRAYAGTLLVGLAFVFPVFAVRDSPVSLGVLLFCMLACLQGISGLLPRFIAGHFPTETRAAALGFVYNVGALGGAVAPVLGARLASGMTLGRSLAVLSSGLTLVVIVLIGFDVPARLGRLVDPEGTRDHLLAPGSNGQGAGGRSPSAGAEASGAEESGAGPA
ncbi:sialate:H+ symport family MFS transporter [Streptomyces sp. NPDC002004]